MTTPSPPQLDPAYRLAALRDRLTRTHGRVLDFAFGSHREPPPAAVVEMIEHSARLGLEPAGADELATLRETLAGMLCREYDVVVHPEGLLPAPSGRAAISALLAAFVRPGDSVTATVPGYPVFTELAHLAGANVHQVPLDPERAFAPSWRALDPCDLADTRLVGLNYPNNPTGAVAADEHFTILDEHLPEDALRFNDATYASLVYQGAHRSILIGDAPTGPRPDSIELYSLTKTFLLGCYGISLLAGPQELIALVRRRSDYLWPPLSLLHVAVAVRCASDWRYVIRRRDAMQRRVERLREALRAVGFRPFPASAGPYVLCEAPSSINGSWLGSAHEAFEVLLTEYETAIVPWDGPGRGFLRFSALYRGEHLAALEDLRGQLNLEYD
jgi:aminotransferase